MTECQKIHGPFRWANVNGDGNEYLIGQGPFGDEFVKADGECVRRALAVGEQARKQEG